MNNTPDTRAFFRQAFREGLTPQKLYSLALDEFAEVQKEKWDAKIDEARDELIDALANYAKVYYLSALDDLEIDYAKIADDSIQAIKVGGKYKNEMSAFARNFFGAT